MPVNVPAEPKKYTTVYDNFKGVDYTDDASNVYKRRSPSGKNMLPDLDGRPYKRTGWGIKFSKEDFITASGLVGVTKVIPLRTHYFSYGGHDFIMVFNSLGVFWIRDDSTEPVLAQLWNGESAGEFPAKVEREVDGNVQLVKPSADHNRAFFFEGAGTAGFYVFVDNDLYKFGEVEDEGLYFTQVEPTVPIVLIGAAPYSCAGTANQSLNMLTDRRTIEYFGDGTDTYNLPSDVLSQDTTKVEILNDAGQWEDIPPTGHSTYGWSVTNFTVKFDETGDHILPPASTIGNVRITYSPKDGVTHSVASGVVSSPKKTTITRKEYYARTKTVTTRYVSSSPDGQQAIVSGYPKTTISAWGKTSPTVVEEELYSGWVYVPNAFRTDNIEVQANYTGEFVDCTQEVTTSYSAYSGSLLLKPSDALVDMASANKTVTEDETEWTRIQSTKRAWYESEATPSMSWYAYFEEDEIVYQQTKVVTNKIEIEFRAIYDKDVKIYSDEAPGKARDAFSSCRKVLNFGNDIYNQVFISSSTARDYRNRAWYCAANDPSYFPELNYIEVGSDDKSIMGLQKVGSYLGIVKMGSGMEASVYLAYPTTFEEDSTYAVKQSVSGIGAISNGAFNILNEEPLFLSERGIMGINVFESDSGKQIRNRSFFINKKLTTEKGLENAISFVHNNLYFLAVNDRCYVLDGAQKSSWANEKTNLQYECYYLENIPAQCFAKMGDTLYFSDKKGNLCYFKKKNDSRPYVDAYSVNGAQFTASSDPELGPIDITELGGTTGELAYLMDGDANYILADKGDDDTGRLLIMVGLASENATVDYAGRHYTIIDLIGPDEYDSTATYSEGDYATYEDEVYVCIVDIDEPEEWNEEHWQKTTEDIKRAVMLKGVPISAEWSTIADDDGMVHFFKNLMKKGCVVSFLPGTGSFVDVSIKADEKDEVKIGTFSTGYTTLPADVFTKKKIKKYKRLQFICRNNLYDNGFALDQIIKTYTVGNYSKNRK